MAEASLKLGGSWATKEGSLLGFNDENGNYKPIPFDFTRATTATRVNRDGLIEEVQSGVPRIDFSGDGSLLLEPQRTNVVPYSEDFSNSGWTKNNTTVTSGFTSPDGTNNAYKMTDDATDSKHGVYDLDVLSQDGNIYTRSVFVKKGTARYVVLSARHLPTSSGTSWIYDFDSNNWTLTGSSGVGQSIEVLSNGWIRLSISHISNSNFNNDFSIGISSGATINDTTYSGSGDTLYIYGAQVEQGSYSTSLIKTSGSAVTRLADVCNNGGNEQVINSTEGVLYFEGSALADDFVDKRIYLSDGTMNNYVSIGYSRFAGNIIAEMISGGVLQTLNWGATGVNKTNNNKFALSWGNGVMKFYVNGTQTNTESATSPTGLNVLEFNTAENTLFMEANVKDIRVYNTALTDQELAALTQV